MSLKDQVKERMDCLTLRRWTYEREPAEWYDNKTCIKHFKSDSDDIYQAREGEEDDDHPKMVGEDLVQKAVEEHFKDLPVKPFVCNQEKYWFSVSVDLPAPTPLAPAPKPQKAKAKPNGSLPTSVWTEAVKPSRKEMRE